MQLSMPCFHAQAIKIEYNSMLLTNVYLGGRKEEMYSLMQQVQITQLTILYIIAE